MTGEEPWVTLQTCPPSKLNKFPQPSVRHLLLSEGDDHPGSSFLNSRGKLGKETNQRSGLLNRIGPKQMNGGETQSAIATDWDSRASSAEPSPTQRRPERLMKVEQVVNIGAQCPSTRIVWEDNGRLSPQTRPRQLQISGRGGGGGYLNHRVRERVFHCAVKWKDDKDKAHADLLAIPENSALT